MATLENYANMNATERNGVLKNDLKTIVDEQLAMLNNDPNTIRNLIVNTINLAIDNKFAELGFDKRFDELTEHYDNEIKRLNDTVKEQGRVLSAQQKFIEDLDSEKRAKHLIVLGLKEIEEEDDQDRFMGITQTIGVSTEIVIDDLVRLGNRDENNPNKTRPLKVTFDKPSMRNEILKNAYKLKNQAENDPYHRVYLKRDSHPQVRNEEKRLYEVFKAEKEKPENADIDVVFDRKTRVVSVNGEEIDRFKLFNSFQ